MRCERTGSTRWGRPRIMTGVARLRRPRDLGACMSKNRLPPLWMPVRVAEFVADTAHFTAEQTGAYFRLLCAMWRQGGSLSDDKAKLARTAGVHPPHFPRVWDAIGTSSRHRRRHDHQRQPSR